jgi:parallel beta-helix repeat protein
MTALSIQPTFPIFTDIDGQPLEDGYVFIGTANLNPITNPITVYWDAALTLTAVQPIRTLGGYPMNSGTPARLYVNSDYSIQVQNKNGSLIYSALAATERYGNVISFADITGTLGSDRVSFLQAGSGAVTRTAQAKMRDVVSVKDFGAVGDGVTNDTAAIQAAVATGKDVYIPTGVYIQSSTVTVSTNGQSIYGDGDLSVIQQSGVLFDLFSVTGNNAKFLNLRFNGAATSQDSLNVYFAIIGDATAQPDNIAVLNCRFSGSVAGEGWRGAVKFNSGCNYGRVENCFFERLWGSTDDCGYGLLTGNVTNALAVGNVGIATTGRGRHLIYFSAGASNCTAAFNYAEGFAEAGLQQFSQGAQPPCYRNTFAYNSLVNCSANGTSTSSSLQISGHSFDAKIIGNQISGSGRNGISVYNFLLSDCSNTTVADNTVVDSKYYGIFVNGATGNNILRGNIVRESSRISAGTYSNIQIDSDDVTPVATTNVLVQGNHSTGAFFARSPIAIAGATPPTGIVMSGNNFPICNVSGISINPGITVTGDNVTGSWTPALTFGGGSTGLTTSTVRGTWVRVGNMVTVTCYIVLTNKGSSTGVAEINGLPFNSATQDAAVALHLVDVTFTDQPQAYVSTNLLQLQNIDNTGTRTNLSNTNFTNTSQVRATVTYFV